MKGNSIQLPRIGKISRWLAPSYGWCPRCLTTWNFVETHDTYYGTGSYVSPMCVKCWRETTTTERLAYYRYWYGNTDIWEDVSLAVKYDEPTTDAPTQDVDRGD